MFSFNQVVYNLNIYRDGSLPAVHQQFHSTNLSILRCSYWAVRAWNHSSLSSPYWRLYWNRQPGATVMWNHINHPLRPDRLVLIGPNTPFTSRLGWDPQFDAETNILVGFPYHEGDMPENQEWVCHLFTHFTLGQPYDAIAPGIFEVPVDTEALEMVDILIRALGADQHHFDHRQSFALHALILFALRHIPEEDWPERQLDPRVLRVITYIDEHLGDRLRNEDFGRVVRMSTNAFTRLFSEKTGTTPLALLNQRRIEKASILLHHTDHSIEEIAEQCGFADRYYFTRVFAKHFGHGPAAYRKRRAL